VQDDLEATATITSLADINGKAYVSVNKALVTQASSAIPVIPLYILLYKIMKEQGIHEGCIEQIQRLYAERLFSGKAIATDEKEEFVLMIGKCVPMFKKKILWQAATTENLADLGDLEGYRSDFHNLSDLDLMV
jgi:enoyl-[acyl-carrier protein] reductase/trans-2-enoyl-CoA reductase (NAD+)